MPSGVLRGKGRACLHHSRLTCACAILAESSGSPANRLRHSEQESLLQVAAFVTILDKDLADKRKTAEVDVAPLLTSSYSKLVSSELAKRLKRVPVAFYAQRPKQLFDAELCKADFAGWSLV